MMPENVPYLRQRVGWGTGWIRKQRGEKGGERREGGNGGKEEIKGRRKEDKEGSIGVRWETRTTQ